MGVNPKNWSIIYNGISKDCIDSIETDKTIEPGSFVACSNTWRMKPNKRPLSIINGFLKSDTGRHLYIIGQYQNEWKKKYKRYRIHFLGPKSPKKVIAIMKACDYQIHLCHIDSCPNAVVEGLACGLNVLCTNLGGTKELVGPDGVILKIEWLYCPECGRKQINKI